MQIRAVDMPRALLIPLPGEPGNVGVHLSLQRLSQHPPRALPHDLIDQRRRLTRFLSRRTLLHYREHGRTFPASVPAPALLET